MHSTRAEYNDANGDSGGVTITLSDAADGSGTVVGGASVGTDTVKYVNQFYGSQYNDVYNASQFTLRLSDRRSTTPYNAFRGTAAATPSRATATRRSNTATVRPASWST